MAILHLHQMSRQRGGIQHVLPDPYTCTGEVQTCLSLYTRLLSKVVLPLQRARHEQKKDSKNQHSSLVMARSLLASAEAGQVFNFLSAEKLRNMLCHFTTLKRYTDSQVSKPVQEVCTGCFSVFSLSSGSSAMSSYTNQVHLLLSRCYAPFHHT